MAYNPFNIFRRNQKALFAVLTVFIMIMFTLQSGVAGGDFFETLMRWLGTGKGSKEAVCKIDGHTVTVGELDSGPRGVQFKRVMANRFMYHAARQTVGDLMGHIGQQRGQLSESGRQMADSAFSALGMAAQFGGARQNPEVARFVEMQLLTAERLVGMTLESPNAKSEDKDVARALRAVFNLSRYLQEGQGEHYFVNAPNKTRRDLVEFLLWKKKAEQLGIRYTKDDVKKLIQNDFFNSFKSDVEVRKILQQTQGFTMDACLDALAVEFQVRSAQTAVLGYGARYHQAQALMMPYEVFEFYREKTSPATYEVLSIPATAFVDKVVGEPSEAEINDLFKKYADAEPNPRSETPGFKEPRKIAIAWLSIKGDEPYYKKLAEEQVKVGEVMAKMSGVFTAPVPGAVGTWMTAVAAPLSIKEPAVDAAYTAATESFRYEMQLRYEGSNITSRDLLQSSVVRPGVVGSTVGAFVGQTAGFGNPLAAVALTMGGAIEYEIRDRVKVGMPLVLGWPTGPSLLPSLVAGAAASKASEPKPLPIEALRPELIKNAIDRRAKTLAFGDPMAQFAQEKNLEKGDIARFIEELGKLTENGKPKDRAAVDKYIKDFIASRGLAQTGATTALRDEWSLEDDPGLRPLVEAHQLNTRDPAVIAAHGGVQTYSPFARTFFWKVDERSGRMVPTSGTFLAEQYPPSRDKMAGFSLGQTRYVVWRTEDIPAQKRNRDTARPYVIAAWKRLKARELAQARANEIAEKIRQQSVTDPALLGQFIQDLQLSTADPKARARTRLFTIPNVAPLTTLGRTGRPQPFSLPESEDIPYPTMDMLNALLDNRDKPPKTVLVVPDAPKDTFYVATLMERKLKSPKEFTEDVYSPLGKFSEVIGGYRFEAMKKARASAVELLKKEFKYEETEDQKKKLDENVKSGGRNAD